MSRKYDIDRRNVLKGVSSLSAIGLSGVAVTGSAAAGGRSATLDFDPSSERELKAFLEKFRQLSQEERQQVFETLSAQQRQAVKNALQPAKITVNKNVGSSPTVSAQDTSSSRTVEISAYSTLGSHLWDWHCEAEWEHDGSSVSDVQYRDWADIHDITWSYDGTVSKSKDVDDDEFEVFREGLLSFLGGTYSYTANPYARIAGYANGDSDVLAKGDGY